MDLLSKDPSLVYSLNEEGQTILHIVSMHCRLKTARALLESLAQPAQYVWVRDAYFNAVPLHWASGAGCQEVARLLISYSEDPASYVSARDKEGRTPLHWASNAGYLETAVVLIENSAHFSDYISLQDNNGWTPLYTPAMYDDMPMVRLLISYADDSASYVSIPDRKGRTALDWAFDWLKNGKVIPFLETIARPEQVG